MADMRDLYDEVATLRQELAEAREQRDRERNAAQHAVDCYRQGNVMGTVVAVDRLGEVLDGGM